MKRQTIVSSIFTAAALLVSCLPVRASAGDDAFETSFRKTYAYQTYLKGDAIRVEFTNGVAILTGTVAEEAHKTLAQATVANLSGVLRVDNQLAIATEATAINADVSLARSVKTALQFHRNVEDGKIYITVKDSVVTLQGQASSPAQKERITGIVADLSGVNGVRNEMSVATPLEPAVQATNNETLDDASITAQIVTVLMTHRSTSSVIPRVSTRNGEVTLTGIAKNEAQNALIVQLVTDTRGVTSVKNQMTIENQPRTN